MTVTTVVVHKRRAALFRCNAPSRQVKLDLMDSAQALFNAMHTRLVKLHELADGASVVVPTFVVHTNKKNMLPRARLSGKQICSVRYFVEAFQSRSADARGASGRNESSERGSQ